MLNSLASLAIQFQILQVSYFVYFKLFQFLVGLKSLLRQGLSEPELYGDLVYKLKKIVGLYIFLAQFFKIISHYKKMAITLMYCNRLHACKSNQSQLATLLSSLIARQWVRLHTL